jgi:hypothetical protein
MVRPSHVSSLPSRHQDSSRTSPFGRLSPFAGQVKSCVVVEAQGESSRFACPLVPGRSPASEHFGVRLALSFEGRLAAAFAL